MQTLLITPPLIQMNSPYPATAYLTGYLRKKGFNVIQKDLSLELLLKIFSKEGLHRIADQLQKSNHQRSEPAQFFLDAFADYVAAIEPVICFLQGRDDSFALRISERKFLPEGPRFLILQDHPEILKNFGPLGIRDKAKYFCSLFLDDICDMIQTSIDPYFEFSRYGEKLAVSPSSFDGLYKAATQKPSLIAQLISEIMASYLKDIHPDLVGFTIPFPGNFLGALQAAQTIKNLVPLTKTVIGGGFINTELRELTDQRIFKFFDYIVFDDGEIPLEHLLLRLQGHKAVPLINTWYFESGKICKSMGPIKLKFNQYATPSFQGLPHKSYFSMMEMPNQMHRLWSDFRWNKMILAHGCYWKKCQFCDIHLDYISRFEPLKPKEIVDTMEQIAMETGSSGFHFVDEAAPPSLLKAVAQEIIKRRLTFTWWGNIRFEAYFTPEVVNLLSDAGCIAVTGGLEVATPRLLKLINKGISIEQVAQVTCAFRKAGVFVHAYLMYGYPTQTIQETIDSLEIVRQLFLNQCLDSGFWHRFACTVHSPIGQNPEQLGLQVFHPQLNKDKVFAVNTLAFSDPTPCDHESLGRGLKKALYNYMHGVGIQNEIQFWFDFPVPKPTVAKNYIRSILRPQEKLTRARIPTAPI